MSKLPLKMDKICLVMRSVAWVPKTGACAVAGSCSGGPRYRTWQLHYAQSLGFGSPYGVTDVPGTRVPGYPGLDRWIGIRRSKTTPVVVPGYPVWLSRREPATFRLHMRTCLNRGGCCRDAVGFPCTLAPLRDPQSGMCFAQMVLQSFNCLAKFNWEYPNIFWILFRSGL